MLKILLRQGIKKKMQQPIEGISLFSSAFKEPSLIVQVFKQKINLKEELQWKTTVSHNLVQFPFFQRKCDVHGPLLCDLKIIFQQQKDATNQTACALPQKASFCFLRPCSSIHEYNRWISGLFAAKMVFGNTHRGERKRDSNDQWGTWGDKGLTRGPTSKILPFQRFLLQIEIGTTHLSLKSCPKAASPKASRFLINAMSPTSPKSPTSKAVLSHSCYQTIPKEAKVVSQIAVLKIGSSMKSKNLASLAS